MRSDHIIARADEALGRIGGPRKTASANPDVNRHTQWAIILFAIVVIIALFTAPFGILLLVLGAAGYGLYSLARTAKKAAPKAAASDLPKADLASLPLKTELWLASQRRLLPPAAQSLTDSICARLKTLSTQIASVAEVDPIAYDIRRLVAEELPQLISDYHRVPAAMRKEPLNGMLPDKQLTQGLIVIDGRLDQINSQLATGPVSQLAVQARYLDLKYQDSST
jgi:hypothetical protein